MIHFVGNNRTRLVVAQPAANQVGVQALGKGVAKPVEPRILGSRDLAGPRPAVFHRVHRQVKFPVLL